VGEICVRGKIVSDGYWKRPDQTAEAFRSDWLHTGDMARRDDEDFIYIVDRKKDMIISGGFNVYPREVEDVLTSHPEVAMAVVVGIPDDQWGEAVKALVVLRPDATVTADELVALVRERKGAVYAPKSLDLVDQVPLTGIGKPDRKAIRAQFWASDGRQVH
jgi:acyl-CoA synthetase (AMP-forming)/AMP-acid ligase II